MSLRQRFDSVPAHMIRQSRNRRRSLSQRFRAMALDIVDATTARIAAIEPGITLVRGARSATACVRAVADRQSPQTRRGIAMTGAICVAIALLAANPEAARAYSAIYAFGDSLSDAGNVSLATGGALPPSPPYVGGRFTNGRTWVELLGDKLGLSPLKPRLAGGTDYAFGGAKTGSPDPSQPQAVPNIIQQVTQFAADVGGKAPSNAVYAVWIGANDLFGIISAPSASPKQDARNVAKTTVLAIGKLNDLVPKGEPRPKILVPLLPDLGKTPSVNKDPAASAAASDLAKEYNDELLADISDLEKGEDIDVDVLDTAALLDKVINDPTSFGFSDSSNACIALGPSCDPNQFVFFDDIHPTEKAHQIIADAALEAIPEPATTLVLGSALVGLFLARRRRAA